MAQCKECGKDILDNREYCTDCQLEKNNQEDYLDQLLASVVKETGVSKQIAESLTEEELIQISQLDKDWASLQNYADPMLLEQDVQNGLPQEGILDAEEEIDYELLEDLNRKEKNGRDSEERRVKSEESIRDSEELRVKSGKDSEEVRVKSEERNDSEEVRVKSEEIKRDSEESIDSVDIQADSDESYYGESIGFEVANEFGLVTDFVSDDISYSDVRSDEFANSDVRSDEFMDSAVLSDEFADSDVRSDEFMDSAVLSGGFEDYGVQGIQDLMVAEDVDAELEAHMAEDVDAKLVAQMAEDVEAELVAQLSENDIDALVENYMQDTIGLMEPEMIDSLQIQTENLVKDMNDEEMKSLTDEYEDYAGFTENSENDTNPEVEPDKFDDIMDLLSKMESADVEDMMEFNESDSFVSTVEEPISMASNYSFGDDETNQAVSNISDIMGKSLSAVSDLEDADLEARYQELVPQVDKALNEKIEKPGFFKRLFGNVPLKEGELSEEELEQNEEVEKQKKNQQKLEEKELKKAKKEEADALKKANAELKQKEKAEAKEAKRKLKEAMNVPVPGKINKVGATICFVFAGIIIAIITLTSSVYPYQQAIDKAQKDMMAGKYNSAYIALKGQQIKEEHSGLYEQLTLIMIVNKQLNSYYRYSKLGMEAQALHSLLKGLTRFESHFKDAIELGVEEELLGVKAEIDKLLKSVYGLNQDEVKELLLIEDEESYTSKVNLLSEKKQAVKK